ncbi:MAG: SMP-30/gluconolactonase/LRE family protein [Acidiphilium sp.]|nr:SMP-30/gluconolactonase/LRE family protein [Acidiphilium sp.]MDD4934622.1 SMP-30/gluconolactonase/LRE family protein [Acidiphilium sp.]
MAALYHIYDPRMRPMLLMNAAIERIATGFRWAEGPVWFGDANCLLWSDIPNDRIMRWWPTGEMDVYRSPANYTNGLTRDRQGRLVSCEHGRRGISRTEYDGSITLLVDQFEGKRLNSPNDLVVKSDGSVWFTDPDYGIMSDYEGHRGDSEQAARRVYRFDPASGALSAVAEDYERPNGIAFSPDERLLYIADTGVTHRENGPHHIRVHDVIDGVRLGPARVFTVIEPGFADGFRLDEHGNVWTSCGSGNAVAVFAPDGALLGKIDIPEMVSNVAFGGPKRNRLFITATSSVYALYLGVRGHPTL